MKNKREVFFSLVLVYENHSRQILPKHNVSLNTNETYNKSKLSQTAL